MANIGAGATHDGRGNVTLGATKMGHTNNGTVMLYDYAATEDGQGNVTLSLPAPSDKELAIDARVRTFSVDVLLRDGDKDIGRFRSKDRLKSFRIKRTGEAKFFGFGICQKLHLELLDPDRTAQVAAGNDLLIEINDSYLWPMFKVTEVNRDENTNALSITAYDALEAANGFTVADLGLTEGYTIKEFAEACAGLLGFRVVSIDPVANSVFETAYPTGANFDGTETIREALNAVAEATQTVYYIDGHLTFRRLALYGDPALTIDRSRYFTLSSKTNRRLSAICSTTELGDNVTASLDVSGTTQYVRNNPFWDNREDVADLVNEALAAVGGLTINQFECEWRGNHLLKLCDRIALETKDGDTAISYLLDDEIRYDGTLSQRSSWNYEDSEETESNPTNLGDVLKQTYARVDKANKQIDIVASETAGNTEAISALQVNTDSISASVQATREYTEGAVEGISGDLADLTSKVSAVMTPDQVQLSIQKAIDDGVSKVATETGFTFDERGLTVSKSGSDLSTAITEDGMAVALSGETVLTANNQGVDAKNLHATTYLIIGDNSRFEDYEKDGEARTGCFWIGPIIS